MITGVFTLLMLINDWMMSTLHQRESRTRYFRFGTAWSVYCGFGLLAGYFMNGTSFDSNYLGQYVLLCGLVILFACWGLLCFLCDKKMAGEKH